MPFTGGCLMFRRDAYERAGGYREVAGTWEDLDLCVRMAGAGRVLVIPQPLYWCRFHVTSRTAAARPQAAVRAALARAEVLTNDGATTSADARAGALFELNAMQLWAGHRPGHLEELRSAARACGAGRRRLLLLTWARWAEASPGSLRGGLRLRSRVRDLLAAPWVPARRPREWRPV